MPVCYGTVALDVKQDAPVGIADLDAPPVAARVVDIADDLPVLVRDVGPRWSRRAANFLKNRDWVC